MTKPRTKPRIVAFVPAKGTSSRISNKNLAILDGEHLVRRKVRQLLDCPLIDEVVLDTESDDVARVVADLPVSQLRRPVSLATNDADGHDIFAFECASRSEGEIFVQALCTAPFVSGDTIRRALEALLAAPDADSLVAVSSVKQYCWDGAEPRYGRGRIPNSVDLGPTVVEAMSLYAVRRIPGRPPPARRFGEAPLRFELDPTELIDINNPSDLVLAEQVCGGQRAQHNLQLQALRAHLSSSLLADVTRDLGLRCVLPRRIVPTSGGRLIGRAKTLSLRRVSSPEDRSPGGEWEGIYRALDSYAFIRPGDVIVVSTESPERAYFGDLNANVALRAGAVGAVVDGMTRDTAEVRRLGFPVHAHGTYCDDVKYHGTLAAMNAPVDIGGVRVENDDVVFADEDGVVVVPRRRWSQVLTGALDALEKESAIRLRAAIGDGGGTLLDRFGRF